MKTRIIGDIHGHWHDYSLLTENIEHNSIQVGDFGRGFNGAYWEERADEYHKSKQHRFIRGNHDSPEVCKNSTGWIKDGTVESYGDKTVMFIGGAWSIDWEYRREGVDWWRDEEVSSEEFYRLIETYAAMKPRVMITHDAPSKATNEMFIQPGLARMSGGEHIKTRTGQALQAMFEIHQPELWFFGHWHHTMQVKIGKTWFHCLGELDYTDFDFSTLEYL